MSNATAHDPCTCRSPRSRGGDAPEVAHCASCGRMLSRTRRRALAGLSVAHRPDAYRPGTSWCVTRDGFTISRHRTRLLAVNALLTILPRDKA